MTEQTSHLLANAANIAYPVSQLRKKDQKDQNSEAGGRQSIQQVRRPSRADDGSGTNKKHLWVVAAMLFSCTAHKGCVFKEL